MQIHETNNFKVDKPFAMPFEHHQDFSPSYMDPVIVRDSTPIPKKGFFRQLLDLPKDIQELRFSQRSVQEDVSETKRDLSRVEDRVDENERKVTGFQDQLDNLSKRSSLYQDRVESLSSSVNPLVGQMAELKNQSLQIHDLSNNLKKMKTLVGILMVATLVLLGLIVRPYILGF